MIIIYFLAVIGAAVTSILLAGITQDMVLKFKDERSKRAKSIQYRKKRGIKPTAKCYCGDCMWYTQDSNRCNRVNVEKRMSEIDFCSLGEERT